eukprot:7019513-Prymnesium_polylepis.1
MMGWCGCVTVVQVVTPQGGRAVLAVWPTAAAVGAARGRRRLRKGPGGSRSSAVAAVALVSEGVGAPRWCRNLPPQRPMRISTAVSACWLLAPPRRSRRRLSLRPAAAAGCLSWHGRLSLGCCLVGGVA